MESLPFTWTSKPCQELAMSKNKITNKKIFSFFISRAIQWLWGVLDNIFNTSKTTYFRGVGSKNLTFWDPKAAILISCPTVYFKYTKIYRKKSHFRICIKILAFRVFQGPPWGPKGFGLMNNLSNVLPCRAPGVLWGPPGAPPWGWSDEHCSWYSSHELSKHSELFGPHF